jgi:SAM-dependent methyltransferase
MTIQELAAASFMYGYKEAKISTELAYNLVNRPASETLLDVITAIQQLPNIGRVLDLGCGDGVLEKNTDSARRYAFTSIDIEPAAICTLKIMFDSLGHKHDTALVGDITKLNDIPTLQDTSFHAVVSWRVLHGISPEHYGAIFQNIHQMLKLGSPFFISVACSDDWKARALKDSYTAEGVNDCADVMFRNYNLERSNPFPVHFFSAEELTTLGKQHNFELETLSYFTEPSGYKHLKDRKNSYIFAKFTKK